MEIIPPPKRSPTSNEEKDIWCESCIQDEISGFIEKKWRNKLHIRRKKLYSSVRKSKIMAWFDSTNILDRLEKTWKIIFSSHWKTLILPPILITAIGYTILVILFLWGGILWYSTYQWINPLEYGIEQPLRIISILLFLLAILVLGTYLYAYFVTYIFIAADLISRWGTPDFKETHEESFHKIWSWFWYMLWYSIIIIWRHSFVAS
jgi:hypothetical protein